MYAARSLAKAIPQAKSDSPNREQLYLKSIEVLKPVVDTMTRFLQYHKVGGGKKTNNSSLTPSAHSVFFPLIPPPPLLPLRAPSRPLPR